nr:hypothetical protein LVJ77_02555 [Conchiformibius kuhniae]
MKLKEKLTPLAKKCQALAVQAKPAVLRVHRKVRPYYPHLASFAGGVAVTALFFVWNGAPAPAADTGTPVAQAAEDAVDWSPLADEMCRPDSAINHLAMKFDFPFESCIDDRGDIDKACVEKDAARFRPTLPEPFDHALGGVQVQLDTGEGWSDMHYLMPLHKAAYHGMPVSMLAVRVETESRNELLGWQTPYLVIQDDFSKIKQALRRYSPAEQTVYYADIPPEKDVLSARLPPKSRRGQSASKRADVRTKSSVKSCAPKRHSTTGSMR